MSDPTRWSDDPQAGELESLFSEASQDGLSVARKQQVLGALETAAQSPVWGVWTAGKGWKLFLGLLSLVVIGAGAAIAFDVEERVVVTPSGYPPVEPLTDEPSLEPDEMVFELPERREESAADTPAPPSVRARRRRPPSRPEPRTTSAEVSEGTLLLAARRALDHSPRQALELTAQHREHFPHGRLSEEREVLAIDALSRLDRKNASSRRGEAFLRRYPSSAHRARVQSILEAL